MIEKEKMIEKKTRSNLNHTLQYLPFDDDVYLGYYSGKVVSYKLPCLHVRCMTHKLSQYGISKTHISPLLPIISIVINSAPHISP
mmetsp:Transcript_1121/g.1264  ORF Transcript_1121/g.1264 Transcript_1121/m.1264 type:complete len:85 (+) Transcript_1121:412-666(+)